MSFRSYMRRLLLTHLKLNPYKLSFKLKTLNQYKTEINLFPDKYSLKFIESLSHVRGVESGFKNAEAFQLIRNFIN